MSPSATAQGAAPQPAEPHSAGSHSAKPLPLEGVRVLDLGQFIAVPYSAQWLAWMGAEVIAVESRRHMTSRSAPPFVPGREGDPDASGYFNLLYGSKKSCTIDMTAPAGRDLVQKLAAACDVVVDNFSTGVLEKLGLGYDVLSRLNPRIIMASCGAFGRTGPLAATRGLHSAVNLFSGVADVTGYPGGGPRILGGVLPDPVGGIYTGFAVLAALLHREKTGEGQFIDVAMYEGLLTLIPEAVIDLTLNGVEPVRCGNRDRFKAPHGIYRCSGDDAWMAISVESEADWRAFCHAIGRGALADDPRFADADTRQRNIDALDAEVEAWTRARTPDAAVDALQAAGVAAGPVRRSDELLHDPQLVARGMVVTTPHPVGGDQVHLGVPWRMDSLGVAYRRAPLLGEHTQAILTDILGIDAATYAQLAASGVLS